MKYKSRYGLKLLFGNIYLMLSMLKKLEVIRPNTQSEQILLLITPRVIFYLQQITIMLVCAKV